MSIPQLDERGLLPEGIHQASVDEIKERFATSAYRSELFDDFLRFMREEIGCVDAPIFMAGSYLSDKQLPNDIEIAMVVNLEVLQSSAGQKILQLGGKDEHDRFESQYRMDFYISLDVEGYNDFRLFFQYVGEKTANTKGISAKDKRGIIKVIL